MKNSRPTCPTRSFPPQFAPQDLEKDLDATCLEPLIQMFSELSPLFPHDYHDFHESKRSKRSKQSKVKAYFSGLDIDPDETKIIFTLLDSDCNGDIDIEATKSALYISLIHIGNILAYW